MSKNVSNSNDWSSIHLSPEYTSYLIVFQNMNMIFGSIGILINIILIIILFSSEFFRCYRRIIFLLAIGDLCNCIYVFLQGYERKQIYLLAFNTGYVKNQTYWTCALKSFDWMGLLGSLIPHIIVFVMGVERIVAVKFPLLYKHYFANNDIKVCIFCFFYVFINMILAFTLAFLNKNKPSRYFCGRKVSYTVAYISFIYGMNVIGYISCFLMTFSIMIYLKFLLRNDKNTKTIHKNSEFKSHMKNYQRIKQTVFISFISSVTISLPNFISLASVIFGPLESIIADSADCISVGKSSINLFVYIIFDKEFQNSIKKIIECRKRLYN